MQETGFVRGVVQFQGTDHPTGIGNKDFPDKVITMLHITQRHEKVHETILTYLYTSFPRGRKVKVCIKRSWGHN